MNIYWHKVGDDAKVLYIDGNLQFDSRDEAVYHESLALPALCLADKPQSVLICGGGDGLALREVLRFPGITDVTLIDCSPEVLDLARSEFAELNAHSLEDSRVKVVVADALEYPFESSRFDAIICDFTFPTTQESAQGFTVEWYQKLKHALRPGGMIAINSVSPQNTPAAFACIVATVKASGLFTLPYRVCIPSFRDHGFGAWGFILASQSQLTIKRLQAIQCPVPTRQVALGSLEKGAHFSDRDRAGFHFAPVNRRENPVLQRLLLDPEIPGRDAKVIPPPEFPHLIDHLEVNHPYHSRAMIETLAEQIAGSLKHIDLHKLVVELSKRAKLLPQRILEELEILRSYLASTVLDLEIWGKWAARLFATVLIVMTIANSISPDPAFAKGHAGLGHSSFSRGFSEHESFGGGVSTRVSAPISSQGFRSTYGYDPVDIYGYHYTPRVYIYNDYSGYGGGGGYSGAGGSRGTQPTNGHQPHQTMGHKPLFVLDDDLVAMDNGDFVVSLSENAILVVSQGAVNLVDVKTGKNLVPVFAEPKLFSEIRAEVSSQAGDLDHEVAVRRDWLSWAGWTSEFFGTVKADNAEYLNLQDLKRRLGGAVKKLGTSSESNVINLEDGAIELFVGCHILSDNRIALYGPGGKVSTSDGTSMVLPSGHKISIDPDLKAALVSVMKKMIKESDQDIASDQTDLQSLQAEQSSTENDLREYQNIQVQNSYDPGYEVDYGTDSIPVEQAIQQTQADLASIIQEQRQLQQSIAANQEHRSRFASALESWSS